MASTHASLPELSVSLPPQRRFYKLDWLVVASIAVQGAMHLPYPFGGDQTLFTLCALKLNQGAVLYKDFWDVKQPGIFWFYLLAGKMFGFTEVGAHALELIYLLAFSIVLIITCKSFFRNRWAASLVPLLTIGVYYGVAGSNHLTKLEPLVSFPIFLSFYWACEAARSEEHIGRNLFLSGVVGGIVLLFKIVLAPVPAAFWISALFFRIRRRKVGFVQEFLRGSVPVLLGLSIPVLCTLLWFAHIHDSGALLYTSFTYPARVVSELPQQDRSGTLLLSLQWFAGNFAPLLALGFVGASLALSSCVDVFVINLVLWIIAGFVVILLQKYSWWEYHFFLLLVPLGILSVKALDECWGKLAQGLTVSRRQRWLVVVFLLLLFSPVLDSWAMLGFRLAHHRFALSPDDRLRFQARLNPVYATVSKEVGFLLRSDSLRGDIFVFGDPRYYYLAHRNQAVAINGAMPELLLPQQWRELTAELAAAEPPYIYVAADQVDFQESRAPEILQFINEKYSILHSNDVGTWYILRASNANPSNANQR